MEEVSVASGSLPGATKAAVAGKGRGASGVVCVDVLDVLCVCAVSGRFKVASELQRGTHVQIGCHMIHFQQILPLLTKLK